MELVRISARCAAKQAAIWRTVFTDAVKTKVSLNYIDDFGRVKGQVSNGYVVKTTYGKITVLQADLHKLICKKKYSSTEQVNPYFVETKEKEEKKVPKLMHIWSLNEFEDIQRAINILKEHFKTTNTAIFADYGYVAACNPHLAGINTPDISPVDFSPVLAN